MVQYTVQLRYNAIVVVKTVVITKAFGWVFFSTTFDFEDAIVQCIMKIDSSQMLFVDFGVLRYVHCAHTVL